MKKQQKFKIFELSCRKAQFQISDFFIFALFVIVMVILLGMINNQKEDLQESVTDDFSYVSGQLLLTTFMRAPVDLDSHNSVNNMADLVALGKTSTTAKSKLKAEITKFVEELDYEWVRISVFYEEGISQDVNVHVIRSGNSREDLVDATDTHIFVPGNDGTPIKVGILLA